MTDYSFTTGGDSKLSQVRLIATGGHGEVHEVLLLQLFADCVIRCSRAMERKYKDLECSELILALCTEADT